MRVAETMREELEELIAYELSDPRIGPLEISEVLVSPDLKKACVRIVTSQDDTRAPTLQALDHARGFLRSRLAERMRLRRTPELVFESAMDIGGDRVAALLKRIHRGRSR
jgi:ribosome-binding factor A